MKILNASLITNLTDSICSDTRLESSILDHIGFVEISKDVAYFQIAIFQTKKRLRTRSRRQLGESANLDEADICELPCCQQGPPPRLPGESRYRDRSAGAVSYTGATVCNVLVSCRLK